MKVRSALHKNLTTVTHIESEEENDAEHLIHNPFRIGGVGLPHLLWLVQIEIDKSASVRRRPGTNPKVLDDCTQPHKRVFLLNLWMFYLQHNWEHWSAENLQKHVLDPVTQATTNHVKSVWPKQTNTIRESAVLTSH